MELSILVIFAALVSSVVGGGKYGPWRPHPEKTKTVTITKTFPTICNCPLERNITVLVPEKCSCPLETIVTTTLTPNLPANCTANPTTTTIPSTGHTTNTTSTDTAAVKPTCSLTTFPDRFFIKDSSNRYLSISPKSDKVSAVLLSNQHATVFHIASAVIGPAEGISQLAFDGTAFDSNATVEYRAFVHNTGGAVKFFSSERGAKFEDRFDFVTASFGRYGCGIQLVALNTAFAQDRLRFAEICGGGGALWLDRAVVDRGCARTVLSVVPA